MNRLPARRLDVLLAPGHRVQEAAHLIVSRRKRSCARAFVEPAPAPLAAEPPIAVRGPDVWWSRSTSRAGSASVPS